MVCVFGLFCVVLRGRCGRCSFFVGGRVVLVAVCLLLSCRFFSSPVVLSVASRCVVLAGLSSSLLLSRSKSSCSLSFVHMFSCLVVWHLCIPHQSTHQAVSVVAVFSLLSVPALSECSCLAWSHAHVSKVCAVWVVVGIADSLGLRDVCVSD